MTFGGNYEPIDAGNGVNDSSIEQSWVNEQQSASEIEIPSFAEETEFATETEQFVSSNQVEAEACVPPSEQSFDNAINSTLHQSVTEPVKEFKGVSFMCPFCYSEFTLTKEQLQEILGE